MGSKNAENDYTGLKITHMKNTDKKDNDKYDHILVCLGEDNASMAKYLTTAKFLGPERSGSA
jgi:hypothetical protein